MSVALQPLPERERVYARLAAHPFVTTAGVVPTTVNGVITPNSHVTPNQEWLACMVASWCAGQSALPDHLGLEPSQFKHLTEYYFPGCYIPEHAVSGYQLDFSRMLEKEDLITLLNQFSQPDAFESDWVIDILVAACLGSDHLWQDLGLWSRGQLSDLLNYNFPDLAAKNDKDMKWKKFLYKQLCEAEGLSLCRAPSCSVCIDYPKCYGAED